MTAANFRRTIPAFISSLLACLVIAPGCDAAIRLPAIVGNHMVVQANADPKIWGWAHPSEEIEARFLGKKLKVVADKDGHWECKLGKIKAGTKFDIELSAENSLTIRDVLAGEVWLCSGQSNMAFELRRTTGASSELESYVYPQIRFFKVGREQSITPQQDLKGAWSIYTPQTASGFSAVGYYFAKELNQELNTPIGMIESTWGGTKAAVWISKDVFSKDPALYYASNSIQSDAGPLPSVPRMPSCLFNSMINPITPFTLRGIIWYQGESNSDRPQAYKPLFQALINDWREKWNNAQLPFLYVQLPGWQGNPGSEGAWAELREAQRNALSLPKTGMTVTLDLNNDPTELHPPNKQPIGHRLALAALGIVYRQKVSYEGPILISAKPECNGIRCRFSHAGKGLRTKDGKWLAGFELCGTDRRFTPAQANIEGASVLVQSAAVPNPVGIRYAWADFPMCNLENSDGLPAPPFVSDITP